MELAHLAVIPSKVSAIVTTAKRCFVIGCVLFRGGAAQMTNWNSNFSNERDPEWQHQLALIGERMNRHLDSWEQLGLIPKPCCKCGFRDCVCKGRELKENA